MVFIDAEDWFVESDYTQLDGTKNLLEIWSGPTVGQEHFDGTC